MTRRARLILVGLLVATAACTGGAPSPEPCAIRVADEFTDTPVEATPVEAIEEAVASGNLDLTDDDLAVLLDQLADLPAGDTPIFVGVEGTTLTISPTGDAWQVTEQETITDC